MKKSFIMLLLLLLTLGATAQNVQLHYDLGHSLYKDLTNRPSVTTTVEMFKPDKWGSTFMFTDIDYQREGVAGAYWEISREFNLTKNKQWAAHIEYNGGLTKIPGKLTAFSMPFCLEVHGIGIVLTFQRPSLCKLCTSIISRINTMVPTHLVAFS